MFARSFGSSLRTVLVVMTPYSPTVMCSFESSERPTHIAIVYPGCPLWIVVPFTCLCLGLGCLAKHVSANGRISPL